MQLNVASSNPMRDIEPEYAPQTSVKASLCGFSYEGFCYCDITVMYCGIAVQLLFVY